MIFYLTHDLIIHLIIFQIVVLLVILTNLWMLHRARRPKPLSGFPMVSILVPARDEERNIAICIQSLLLQDYPSFEIIVLDDLSTDSTLPILMELEKENPCLKIISGSPPAQDQGGKNWACSQLAIQAQGDYLLFTDADTLFQPQALRSIITSFEKEQADLLTGFPHQKVVSWGERLLVPFFPWASISFIPLWLAERLPWRTFTVAVGQLMLFRREAYQAVGGHESLGTSVVDDLTLARRLIAAGYHICVASVSDLITCRMYHNSREAFEGFTKNLFAAFDFRVLLYLFVFLWLAILFWVPLIVLIVSLLGFSPYSNIHHLQICLGLSLLLWLVPYLEFGIPLYMTLLFPVTIVANEIVAFRSMFFSLTNRLVWKGRQLAQPKWKWF
ncbi:MAG: glycosyltransferase family 2 protein [Anaerolineaceae bacterium]